MSATILSPSDTEVYTPEQVARMLKVSTKTLANRRYLGDGPPYFKDGGIVRYRRSDLDAYYQQRTVACG